MGYSTTTATAIAWVAGFIALTAACAPVPDGAALGSAYVPMWRASWEVAPGTSERFGLGATPIAVGFRQPTSIGHAADGSGRLYVAEQPGTVRVVDGGEVDAVPFLDLRERTACCGEQGLLGFVADPRFAESGRVYVSYTDLAGDVVVARYTATPDGRRADPTSEVVVLRVAQPGPTHNGGALAFGPDGHLYVSLGDGGFSVAARRTAARTDVLLGKVLRLDVRELPYRIPDDNPFVGVPGARGEIWALGLRNPWRMSFDRRTGDLYIGDVGQTRWEEVDVAPASVGGLDFGWPRMEGAACLGECAEPVGEPPALVYGRGDGCAVTGGFVYRGRAIPQTGRDVPVRRLLLRHDLGRVAPRRGVAAGARLRHGRHDQHLRRRRERGALLRGLRPRGDLPDREQGHLRGCSVSVVPRASRSARMRSRSRVVRRPQWGADDERPPSGACDGRADRPRPSCCAIRVRISGENGLGAR